MALCFVDQDLVVLIWCFTNDMTPAAIQSLIPSRQLDGKTILQWQVYLRETCMNWHLRILTDSDRKVGGYRPDGTPMIVQVDEVSGVCFALPLFAMLHGVCTC
jgi:hypothetical protein